MRDPAGLPLIRRRVCFQNVGLAGGALQLGLLALLPRAGWPYLPATLLAVELTVLHNLAWHERWTWRDRPTGAARERVALAARFHSVNGVVSLVGNMTLTW